MRWEAIVEPKIKPPPETPHEDIPSNGNGNNPMPTSLHGYSSMDIRLMAIDGNLSGPEQDWWDKRKGPPIDFSRYGEHAWMIF